jgi:hypothetical protein
MMPGILIAFDAPGTVAIGPTAAIFLSEIATAPSATMPVGVSTVPETTQSAAAPTDAETAVAKAAHARIGGNFTASARKIGE